MPRKPLTTDPREKLRIWILRRMTQAQFADRAGLTEGHLSNILSGRRRGSVDTLVAIERATNGWVKPKDWIRVATVTSPHQTEG